MKYFVESKTVREEFDVFRATIVERDDKVSQRRPIDLA